MAKRVYEDEALKLSQVIDIAVYCFNKFPPTGFEESHIKTVTDTYLYMKRGLVNPEPQYKNLKSLEYVVNDVFTYFNESSGTAVDNFWKQINEHNLNYKRENRLKKVLSKKRISNQVEYDFVIDVIVAYQQEGIIDNEEVLVLNSLLLKFEQKSSVSKTL